MSTRNVDGGNRDQFWVRLAVDPPADVITSFESARIAIFPEKTVVF